MITVQEITQWADSWMPNHKYIMSDDMRLAYAYIKQGETKPYIFNTPLAIDSRRRKFKVLVKTKDVDVNERSWKITGSKGSIYKVVLRDGNFTCTCPSALYRGGVCKHITQTQQELDLGKTTSSRL